MNGALGDWVFIALLLFIVMILARIVWVSIQDDRRAAARKREEEELRQEEDLGSKIYDYYKWSSRFKNRRDLQRRRAENKGMIPELVYDDIWNEPFPAGKQFVNSSYLNLEVLDEGFTEIGSRYRILKDNETGVLYYADRGGMTLLMKDYARTRYA